MISVTTEAANGKGYRGDRTGANRLHGSSYKLQNLPRIGDTFDDGERGSAVVEQVIFDRNGYITLMLR